MIIILTPWPRWFPATQSRPVRCLVRAINANFNNLAEVETTTVRQRNNNGYHYYYYLLGFKKNPDRF